MQGSGLAPLTIIVLIILIYLVLGCLMDSLSMVILHPPAPDAPMRETFKGVMPFFATEMVRVALLVAFPAISLLLPRLLG